MSPNQLQIQKWAFEERQIKREISRGECIFQFACSFLCAAFIVLFLIGMGCL